MVRKDTGQWKRSTAVGAIMIFGVLATGSSAGVGADQTPAVQAAVPPSAPADAKAALAESVEAMGGERVLRGLTSISLEVMGHQWALEQSERPEGPWLSTYVQRSETRDLVKRRGTIRTQRRDWNFPEWSPAVTTVVADGIAARTNGQRWGGGLATDVADFARTLDLAPERLLLTALAAPDLALLPAETHQGVLQRVVGFTHSDRRVRLFLNGWTHLPTMLELVSNDRFGIWGDVTERRWFTFWTLEQGGLMYPRQTSTEWNGWPYSDETIHALALNPMLDDSMFQIPTEATDAYAANAARPSGMASLPLDESRVTEVAPGVTQVPGGFNVALVRQPDGIVVIEATTVSSYSEKVMALVTKRYPGLPIKAVITTSDAWPHLGGLREYVARGIRIYALDLNVPIVSRLIAAPHTIAPDALARAPRRPDIAAVSSRTVIGEGTTRLELIPVRGEFGERMMVIWMPGPKLLYSSDLIQPGRPGTNTFFMPAMLKEVVATASREHLPDIERVFGMHLLPRAWTDVLAAVAAASSR